MGKKHDKDCSGGEDCLDERHLCKIAKKSGPEKIRNIVKDAKYLCSKCGRAAREEVNLCKPVDL
jgi:hypothetical protein